MGTRNVRQLGDPDSIRRFTTRLLADLRALERMIETATIESGAPRIGAEQEVVVVDSDFNASAIGPRILADGLDPRISTEFGAFNLEINTDPIALRGRCLREMEQQLRDLLSEAGAGAARHGGDVLLCGILPTLRPQDLRRENMTPETRYAAIEQALGELRGEDYRIYIKGIDELLIDHDSSMLEASNTSFQLHLQVDSEEFAQVYNASLLAAAPALAVATNSPLVFGRRLWSESRIALFQQSVDTRRAGGGARHFEPRVQFGRDWVEASPVELFRDDIARFRVLVGSDSLEDPLGELDAGRIPRLDALRLFNSTVYRWIRPCYGLTNGVPHLRIENRLLPAGPTLTDEIANAAFWYGLVRGLVGRYADVREVAQFDHAKGNLVAAARLGLGGPLRWVGGQEIGARRLVLDQLLEVAHEGLDRLGIDPADRDHYLGIIENRVSSRRTGSAWTLAAFEALGGRERRGSALRELTSELLRAQRDHGPVHEWPRLRPGDVVFQDAIPNQVDELMSTDLLTVRAGDPIELAMRLMQWRHVRHIPVEDEDRRLTGLVTRGDLFRYLADRRDQTDGDAPVGDVMCRELVTVPPHTLVSDALAIMRERGLSALPVVRDDRLIGLVTERDFLGLAARMAASGRSSVEAPTVPDRSW